MKRILLVKNKDNEKFKKRNVDKAQYGQCTRRLIHFTSLFSNSDCLRVAMLKRDSLHNYKLTASGKVLYKILDFRSRFGSRLSLTGNDLNLKDSRMLKRVGIVYTERKATGYSFKIDLTRSSEYLVHLFSMVKAYLNLSDMRSESLIFPVEVHSDVIKLMFGICELNEHLLKKDFFRNKNSIRKRELGLESVRFINNIELYHTKLLIFFVNQFKLDPNIKIIIKKYLGISNLFEFYKYGLIFN